MDSAGLRSVPAADGQRNDIDMTGAAVLGSAGGAVLGAVIGSFLAAVLLRWPRGESACAGRSRCDHCGVALGPGALVPLLSFAAQRGRCRTCGARIARAHPAMELAGAGVGAACGGVLAGLPGLAAAGMVLGWTLLLLAALDLTRFWLPDRLTLPLAAAGVAAAALGAGPPGVGAAGGLAASAIGLAGGYGALALVSRAYRLVRGRDGLGGGDPKLFGAIGAWLGWAALPHVLLAAAGLGLTWTGLLILSGRKPQATTRLPLGALLAMAAWPLWIVGQLA